MTRKDHIRATEIVRERYRKVKSSSDGIEIGIGLSMIHAVEEAFVQLFHSNPLFNEDKFRQACKVK